MGSFGGRGPAIMFGWPMSEAQGLRDRLPKRLRAVQLGLEAAGLFEMYNS